jgi:acyl-CoA synthetase (AMP-forming)/AMP-acid ligase II
MNIADALSHHVTARPDHPAIVAGATNILYRDLDPLVRRSAAHIADLGLAEGDIVGVALRDSVEHLVILYALARRGAVLLPMDWRWTVDEKQRVALHFGAKRVLVEPDAEALPGLATLPIDAHWQREVAAAPVNRSFRSGGEQPLLLSLSSGTTGTPKGPMLNHTQFLRRFWTHWINLKLNSHERYVSATPMYFGGGRTFNMSLLFSGGTVILFPPPYTPEALVAEIVRSKATSLFLVPTLIRRLLDLSFDALAPMRGLNVLLSSGSALHPDERRLIREKLCPNFYEYYASTEGGGISVLTPEDQAVYADSVGRPIFAVDVQVVGDDHLPLPPDAIGLLRYRGPGVATGFYNNPVESAEVFRDGWFYPGDLAAIDARGYVFLKGRRKDMIIRGGVNIYPNEIEAVLLSHPAVTEAAVVPWPSRVFSEEIAAFVAIRSAVEREALIAYCRERLASYKVPKEVFVIEALPKNTLGKIVKASLAARLTPL